MSARVALVESADDALGAGDGAALVAAPA